MREAVFHVYKRVTLKVTQASIDAFHETPLSAFISNMNDCVRSLHVVSLPRCTNLAVLEDERGAGGKGCTLRGVWRGSEWCLTRAVTAFYTEPR